MTDAFARLVDPILHHVLDLRDAFRRGEHPSPESVKRSLTRLLQEAQGSAPEALGPDFALARYALVYWADEVLIKSPWRHADAWKNSILELDYFGTRRAAVDFWARAKLAESRAQGTSRIPPVVDPLEVYFLCAALGFRGELFQDEAEIEAWAARVAPLIRAGAPEPLPPAPRGLELGHSGELRGERLLLIASVLASTTAVLTILGFIAAVHNRGT